MEERISLLLLASGIEFLRVTEEVFSNEIQNFIFDALSLRLNAITNLDGSLLKFLQLQLWPVGEICLIHLGGIK